LKEKNTRLKNTALHIHISRQKTGETVPSGFRVFGTKLNDIKNT